MRTDPCLAGIVPALYRCAVSPFLAAPFFSCYPFWEFLARRAVAGFFFSFSLRMLFSFKMGCGALRCEGLHTDMLNGEKRAGGGECRPVRD